MVWERQNTARVIRHEIWRCRTTLNRELSSLLEEKQDIPPINLEIIREHVMSFMSNSGKPKYDGVIYKKFGLNERGELLLGDKIIDDGEDVEWT